MAKKRGTYPGGRGPHVFNKGGSEGDGILTTQDIRPIVLPNYAERYIGRDGIAAIQLIAEACEEYDRALKNNDVPVALVIDLMNLDGTLDSIYHTMENLYLLFQENNDIAWQNMTRDGRTVGSAFKRLTQATNDIIISTKHRPLAHLIIKDIETSCLFDIIVASIQLMSVVDRSIIQSRYAYEQPLALCAIAMEKKFPEMMPSMRPLLDICHLAEQGTRHPIPIDAARAAYVAGERIFDDLRTRDYIYPFSAVEDNPDVLPPSVRRITVHSPEQNPFALCIVEIDFEYGLAKTHQHATLSLSRVEYTLSGAAGFLSNKLVFQHFQANRYFELLVSAVVATVQRAVQAGTIRSIEESLRPFSDDSEEPTATANQASDDPVFREDEIPRPHSPRGTDLSLPQPGAPTTEISKQQRLPRFLSYQKTVHTLERLGCTVQLGGRHPKVEYHGKTCPIPNAHDENRLKFSLIIRKVLTILGLSIQDFIIAYK